MSVTNPGAQSDVSGTAITAVPISATDSSSTATLTYSDGGTLPPGLSIDPTSGSITGTPTTGGTYPVTITATDDAGYSGSATFTWTITNTVSVTSPGDQTDGSGTAITAVPISATDSSDGHPHLLGRRDPAAGAVHRCLQRLDHRHADHRRRLRGDHHRHRRLRCSGSATFNWTITNTVSVTSPGDQTDGSGTAITAVPISATDSSSTATLTYCGQRDPAAGAVHRSVQRLDHRHAHHRRRPTR